MADNHIDQLARSITAQPNKRKQLLQEQTFLQQAKLLFKLSRKVRASLLSSLTNEDLTPILESLDPDRATDLIQELPQHRQRKVIDSLNSKLKDSVETLLKFNPQQAAGLMHIDYVQIDEDATVTDVAKLIAEHEQRTGKEPVVITIKGDKISGHIPNHYLILAQPDQTIANFKREALTITHNADLKEVTTLFKENPHSRVIVTNDEGSALGIIYSDDVLQLIAEADSNSLYSFAGVHREESVDDSIGSKVNFRYKWLIINLFTAFLASFTVSLFNDTIAKYVLLAVYMPIVAGMGGNSATQTLVVIVRGIALKQVDLKTALPVLRRELGASLVNGIINGLIVATIVIAFNQDILLALVLASAMIINLLVAAFFGTLVPLIMTKLGKDPATSATIFITTATDVLGFLTFLGLATLILR